MVGATVDLNDSSSTGVCFPFFDKNLSNLNEKKFLLVYISQGKGDNPKNPECSRMGPKPGQARRVFFFF